MGRSFNQAEKPSDMSYVETYQGLSLSAKAASQLSPERSSQLRANPTHNQHAHSLFL